MRCLGAQDEWTAKGPPYRAKGIVAFGRASGGQLELANLTAKGLASTQTGGTPRGKVWPLRLWVSPQSKKHGWATKVYPVYLCQPLGQYAGRNLEGQDQTPMEIWASKGPKCNSSRGCGPAVGVIQQEFVGHVVPFLRCCNDSL